MNNKVKAILNQTSLEELEAMELNNGWDAKGTVEHYENRVKEMLEDGKVESEIVEEIEEETQEDIKNAESKVVVQKLQKELIGEEMSVLDLSNKLQGFGCEDICDLGGLEECLKDGNIVVAIDETGEDHIQIYYDVTVEAEEDEVITATYIKITDVEEF
ncbi:MAG: hypothetical protein ACRCX8_06535 [Sarcina sp.]